MRRRIPDFAQKSCVVVLLCVGIAEPRHCTSQSLGHDGELPAGPSVFEV